jgi:petrobactin synthase
VHGELDYDIKVHCFVSCVCDGLKKRKLDHRPFYFGIWDTPFAVGERAQLLYHGPGITQDFFRSWFERLYGVAVEEWYDAARSKDENIETLLARIAQRPSEGSVMVMLDMFHLPERENKFNQNPFPHYLMLEASENPRMFSVLDPDYRWEGEIARETVLNAVRQPTVAGGYAFDGSSAHPPGDADVRAYFEACFRPHDNPLADRLREIVRTHLAGRDGLTVADLPLAVRELPVITIRKYAYEHGFAYFWRALKLPAAEFDPWCDEIETLVQLLKTLHYDCMKLGQAADAGLAAAVLKRIDDIDAQEFKLKRRLGEIFDQWCMERFPGDHMPEARRAVR